MRILTSFLIGMCILLGVGNMVYSGWIDDHLYADRGPLHCAKKWECDLKRGYQQVPQDVTGINVTDDAGTFIQKMVNYLMGFVSVVGVLYIIYAGFRVLTGWGAEEAQTDAKKTIIAVMIGIVLMRLARGIVMFILRMLG